jgi:zinc/manganese transport system substrate-binding protein
VTTPAYPKALATALAESDPGHKPDCNQRLQTFPTSLQPLKNTIAALCSKCSGTPDVAAFENDLRKRQVRLLLFNSQASNAAAQRVVRIAQQANVPDARVTETEPVGTIFQIWMMGQLSAVSQALSSRP